MSEEPKKQETNKKSNFDFSPALIAIKAIKEKEGNARKLNGEIVCPTCGKILRYSIASNGHIHGRCDGGETAFLM